MTDTVSIMNTQAPFARAMSDRGRTIAPVSATKSIVTPDPSYVAGLKRRVEGMGKGGATKVAAKAGKMSRATLHKLFRDPAHSTIEVADRIRAAIVEMEPRGEALPPVAVAVLDAEDFAWIERGRSLRRGDPEAFAKMLASLPEPKRRRK